MDDLVQLIPFIIIALTLLGRVFRRKKPRESEQEAVLEDEQEVTLPPWGNLETMEGNTGFPDFLEQGGATAVTGAGSKINSGTRYATSA